MSVASQEGLFVVHILEELGYKPTLCVLSDSSAARAVVRRRGVGKMNHVEVKLLWLQDALREKRLTCQAVPTEYNLADFFTKGLATKRHQWLSEALGLMHEGDEQKAWADGPTCVQTGGPASG